jgi:S-sulfo-L-cysteine synthase (O-acetyl-L-serine-dependent)
MTTTTIFPADPALLSGVRALESEIGHTPLYRLTRLFQRPGVEIYAKQEWL